MILPRRLSHQEHVSFSSQPMRNVTADPEGAIDLAPYLEAIPREDLRGATLGDVAIVYRDATGQFDHVHFETGFHETYIVVVVDRQRWDVVGHHFLDLPRLYGQQTDRLDD